MESQYLILSLPLGLTLSPGKNVTHCDSACFGQTPRKSSSNPLCRPDFDQHYCERGFMVYLLPDQQRIRTAEFILKNDSSLGTKNFLFYPSASFRYSHFSSFSNFILFPCLIFILPELWNCQ